MLAFIPCRSGSKSIPDKNIRYLGDKPLLAWTIETAQELGLRTVVSSDSQKYLDIAEKWGADMLLLRPPELAQDTTSMYEVLKAEIPLVANEHDIIVLMQPTTPFRSKESITKALEMMKDYDCVVSVSEVTSPHPDEMFVETERGIMLVSGLPVKERITRRQDFRKAYVPTGSFYIFKSSNLDGDSFYGDRVGVVVERDYKNTVNINNFNDWEKAESLLKENV